MHNSKQLNKPKQVNMTTQQTKVNPDLVILIRPSVRKRGGPFREVHYDSWTTAVWCAVFL